MGYKIKRILVGTQQVRPSGWTPGSNTVAYYKFDGNLNDSSGNNRNLSVLSGSVSYGTASGGGKYAYFNSSSAPTSAIVSGINYDGTNTVSLWVYPRTKYSSGTHGMIDMWEDNSNTMYRLKNTIGWGYISASDGSYDASVNNWYNVVMVRVGTTAKIYINGSLTMTGTPTRTGRTNQTIYFSINHPGNSFSSSYSNDAYYSEVIWESKEWTAQEVSDYYNQTKSNYGL